MGHHQFFLMETQISSLVTFVLPSTARASPFITSRPEVFTYSFIITFYYELLHNNNGVRFFISGAYKQIAMEMIVWMSDNPAPATFLLISGNDSFSSLLHDLSVRSHSILLCGPSQLDESLTANANFIWHWPTLISQGRPLDQVTFKI